jgi:hypothetical protein
MSHGFRFPSHRLLELIKAAKCLRSGQKAAFKDEGDKGKKLVLRLDLVDGPFADFVLHVSCYDAADPTTYKATLVLESERVRSVHYGEVERTKFFKKYLPKGWHENIVDPNLPTSEAQNRHREVPGFAPTDLEDFLRRIAALWHIDLDFEERLL